MPADTEIETTSAQSTFGHFRPVAEGVSRLTILFVNLYAVDVPGGFVLVDAGLPASAWYTRKAIAAKYGPDAKPVAIVLTHAHFDHAGGAKALAEFYDVPVYVHELETPYVLGESDYAPADPTPGGAICFMARLMPANGFDLGRRVKVLPSDNTVPPMPGWTWLHTPGHSVGHVSFLRENDRVAVVGDALATFDMDSWKSHPTWPREIARPATPFTPDWTSARASIDALADAKPTIVAAGHGLPMYDPDMEHALRTFARAMQEPDGGRYAGNPARYDAEGKLTEVPPPVPDPIKIELLVAGGVVGLVAGAGLVALASRKKSRAAAEVG